MTEAKTPSEAWLDRRRRPNLPTTLPDSNLEEADVVRRMFFVGCCGLPIFWLAASINFRHALYETKDTPLRYWAIGFLFAFFALLIWIISFQVNYKQWALEDWRIV